MKRVACGAACVIAVGSIAWLAGSSESLAERASRPRPVAAVEPRVAVRLEAPVADEPRAAPFAPVSVAEKTPLARSVAAASDPAADLETREDALEQISRSPDAGPEAVELLARLASGDPSSEVRDLALASLQHLALEHHELAASIRGALLALAERDSNQRAAALEGLPAPDARDLGRLLAFLEDRDPTVRLAVASPLRDVPTAERGRVVVALERAVAVETNDLAARALGATLRRLHLAP